MDTHDPTQHHGLQGPPGPPGPPGEPALVDPSSELRRVVSQYPKLSFRVVAAVLAFIGLGAMAWMTAAYAQLNRATADVQVLEKSFAVHLGQHTLALAEINRRLDEMRLVYISAEADRRDIQKDIKELLRGQSRAAQPQAPH